MAARVTSESARRISGCVTALLREQPFFGSLALRLPIRADASRETVASDGREIRYSPRWIAEAQAHVIETAMARIVLACALKHHTRRGPRDPERWQRASQLVTHGLLRDAGFTLPPDAEAWDGISVEQAYDRLPEPDPDDGDGDATRRPAGEQLAPIPPAHQLTPQTPAVTMIQAGPTTGPAMAIRRTATARIRTPAPTHPPAAIPPAPARSWMPPPMAGRAAPAHPRPR